MTNKWQSRQETYYQLSTANAYLDNDQVQALFAEGNKTEGWGTNRVITLDGTKIFVKSIPVTAVRAAARGQSLLDPAIAGGVLQEVVGGTAVSPDLT